MDGSDAREAAPFDGEQSRDTFNGPTAVKTGGLGDQIVTFVQSSRALVLATLVAALLVTVAIVYATPPEKRTLAACEGTDCNGLVPTSTTCTQDKVTHHKVAVGATIVALYWSQKCQTNWAERITGPSDAQFFVAAQGAPEANRMWNTSSGRASDVSRSNVTPMILGRYLWVVACVRAPDSSESPECSKHG
ncbi:DUF2690 domain-containing protein [Streptomyces sp. W16]|uniref:DUF2690 domain-containing protein n=1 Tax=Streptomyces sp. W16 TaxID=3076631 RepID=UPI003FA3BCBC